MNIIPNSKYWIALAFGQDQVSRRVNIGKTTSKKKQKINTGWTTHKHRFWQQWYVHNIRNAVFGTGKFQLKLVETGIVAINE